MRTRSLFVGLLAHAHTRLTRMKVEQVDINDVVAEIVRALAPPSSLAVVCDSGVMLLWTHRSAILKVLRNLISYGLNRHHRTEGRITISMRLTEGVAQFRVSDDGPGVPVRFQEHIFRRFRTLARPRNVGSNAMGLAIAKNLVESHGGKIWIESSLHAHGRTFRVYLEGMQTVIAMVRGVEKT